MVDSESSLDELNMPEMMREIEMSEIEAKNSADACWIVIDNRVYDVSDFADMHPGGAGILQAYGTPMRERMRRQRGSIKQYRVESDIRETAQSNIQSLRQYSHTVQQRSE